MVVLTEEFLRKRSEHNEGILSTLKEISLHQFQIEKIEGLGSYCRSLEILLMQDNLVSKIENVHHLKNLQYLNLAINNISIIENLESCEVLHKLDLSVNFIVDIFTVQNLKNNIHLEDLYLIGNPCSEIADYRNFVILTLPQLRSFDGVEIEKSERIKARQDKEEIMERVQKQMNELRKKDFRDDREARIKAYKEIEEKRAEAEKAKHVSNKKEDETIRKHTIVVKEDGTVLQKNEGSWEWEFSEDEESLFLNVAIGRYIDTSLVNLSVQPKYVDMELKKKHLCLNLTSEVHPDKVSATRSQVTGHLLIKLPKVMKTERKEDLMLKRFIPPQPFATGVGELIKNKQVDAIITSKSKPKKATNIENAQAVDIKNILKDSKPNKVEKVSPDFVDDPDVPPLED